MKKNKFKSIGILCRPGDKTIEATVHTLSDIITTFGSEVRFDATSTLGFNLNAAQQVDREVLGKNSDLLVIVGGDGTLLDAARTMNQYHIPMVGVNLGRLGFLVDVLPNDISELIPQILSGEYMSEPRIMLELNIKDKDGINTSSLALNDIVVHKTNVARMIEFEVFINDSYVYTQRSDGLIIATPTGSTAYALSGGGPILHPSLEAISLVPICPHTLSNRPIAVDANAQIEIKRIKGQFDNFQISCDGQVNHIVENTEQVTIKMHQHKLQLLHPTNYDYYQLLRAKLNWAAQHYTNG